MASLYTKLRLLHSLLHGERALGGPVWLVVELTRRCNFTCLGCFFHSPAVRQSGLPNEPVQDLSSELVEKICAELPALGTRHVILVGRGETLLHPRLFDFLAAFRQAGFNTVEVFTNGTLLDRRMARRLVHSGVDLLRVTFWAVNPEEHEQWHPGTSASLLEKRLEGLRLLAEAKQEAGTSRPEVSLEMPLHRGNMDNLAQRVEVALGGACDLVTFTYFRDYDGPCRHLTVSPEDAETLRPALVEAGQRLEAGGVRHNIPAYLARARAGHQAYRDLPCYVGWYGSYVNVDGTVMYCSRCSEPMGNLLEQPFSGIWHGQRYREYRRRTVTRAGLESLGPVCKCANCCLVPENEQVHRVFRWFTPLARKAAD
ncbi:MAG: radical SAM protein [Acidobacteria bacterium]|nr:radical SAM protein [Acidobacteriota bacterium]